MSHTSVHELLNQLNGSTMIDRLNALQQLKGKLDDLQIPRPVFGHDINNHIHTSYSFSPYSPTKAIWMAYMAGLSTAGIMDHDAIAGAREFTAAGRMLGLPTTIGAECRASFAATPLVGRRINNPDQKTVAYVALHGVPHSQIDALDQYLQPIRRDRGIRNRRMTQRLNDLLAPAGLTINYDRDVVPLSSAADGGEITERHLLYAVAIKLIERFSHEPALIEFLIGSLKLPVSEISRQQLTDPDNKYQAYDLLGLLKSDLVEKFYLPATSECPPISEIAAFAKEHGIVLAYPYLGDVSSSVTGDKRTQTFEDSYLPELFALLKEIGFHAVTYMPSRNSRDQLIRLRSLCDQYQFFQISGEDINQPRQAFVCEAMREPMFANLYDAVWALIGHERMATEQLDQGMFASPTVRAMPDLNQRICHYRDIAFRLYGKND